jgi:hypothetical protein
MIGFTYKKDVKATGKNKFLPLLHILENYALPRPSQLMRTNAQLEWEYAKIASFTDKKLIRMLNAKNRHPDLYSIILDNDSENHVTIGIGQGQASSLIVSNLKTLNIIQIKSLFFELLLSVTNWEDGACGSNGIYSEYLSTDQRDYTTVLYPLQYFSRAKIESCGGFAVFENNPYLTTQRIHDGLVVEVQDALLELGTAQSNALIAQATRHLPQGDEIVVATKK